MADKLLSKRNFGAKTRTRVHATKQYEARSGDNFDLGKYQHPSNFGRIDHSTGRSPRKYTPSKPFNIAEKVKGVINDAKDFGTRASTKKSNTGGHGKVPAKISSFRSSPASKRGYQFPGANKP